MTVSHTTQLTYEISDIRKYHAPFCIVSNLEYLSVINHYSSLLLHLRKCLSHFILVRHIRTNFANFHMSHFLAKMTPDAQHEIAKLLVIVFILVPICVLVLILII